MMNISSRLDSYYNSYPNYCKLTLCNDRFFGIWMMGNNYKSGNKYYGEFPNSLNKRILSLFPDCKTVLYVCSGKITDNNDKSIITYDINPELKPTIVDNVENIMNHKDELSHVDLVIIDPPYTTQDFEKYGVRPFNKKKLITNISQIVESGKFLVWLDTLVPIYSKQYWNLIGHIGIIISTNRRIRDLSFYQKPKHT